MNRSKTVGKSACANAVLTKGHILFFYWIGQRRTAINIKMVKM